MKIDPDEFRRKKTVRAKENARSGGEPGVSRNELMRQRGIEGGDLRCRQWQGAIAMTEIWVMAADFQEQRHEICASLSCDQRRNAARLCMRYCNILIINGIPKVGMRGLHGSRESTAKACGKMPWFRARS